MFVGRTLAHIIPDAPFKVSLYDYLGALTQGVTAIRVSQGRYSNKYVSLTPCDTRPLPHGLPIITMVTSPPHVNTK